MIRSFRQLAVAAVAVGAASGAFAAQTTVEFKTFYDTSTILNLTDKKTLDYSVASLTLKDVSGGVQGTLVFNDTAFPSGSKGLAIDELWLADSTKGTVTKNSGAALTGTYYKNGFYQEGGKYNYDLQYKAGTFTEASNSQFTISGVTVASFLNGDNLKGIGLEVTGIGKPYTGFLGLTNAVHFVGNVVAVPEPSTYALMGLGLVGIAFTARKRKAA